MSRKQLNNRPSGSLLTSSPAISQLSAPGGRRVYPNPTKSSLATGPSKPDPSVILLAKWDRANGPRLRDAACLDSVRGTHEYQSLLSAYTGLKDATTQNEWLNGLRQIGSESGLDVRVFTDNRNYKAYMSRHDSLKNRRTDFTNPKWQDGQPTKTFTAALPIRQTSRYRSEGQNTEVDSSDRDPHLSAASASKDPQQESIRRYTTTTPITFQTQISGSHSHRGSNNGSSDLQAIFGTALHQPFIPKHERKRPAPHIPSLDKPSVDGYTSEPNGYHAWEGFRYGPPETYANQGPGPGRQGFSKGE